MQTPQFYSGPSVRYLPRRTIDGVMLRGRFGGSGDLFLLDDVRDGKRGLGPLLAVPGIGRADLSVGTSNETCRASSSLLLYARVRAGGGRTGNADQRIPTEVPTPSGLIGKSEPISKSPMRLRCMLLILRILSS